jgi:hypothetical protein
MHHSPTIIKLDCVSHEKSSLVRKWRIARNALETAADPLLPFAELGGGRECMTQREKTRAVGKGIKG